MTDLLTAAQMRAIEQAAIASGTVTGLELMERAGQGVVAAVLEEWPDLALTSHRAVVLCGPGNNGGDGFVVARLLRERGWEVEVFLYGDAGKLPPDGRVNHERWAKAGATTLIPFPDFTHEQGAALGQQFAGMPPALVVDAIFGTGLTRPVCDGLGSLFQWLDMALHPDRHLVAVDIPTGLCSDSGVVIDGSPDRSLDHTSFRAHLTVTFGAEKIGHYLGLGPHFSGKLICVDIELGRAASDAEGSVRLVSAPAKGCSAQPLLCKAPDHHKYDHGHALILSGPPTHGGAARLAARAALRIGSGLVTVGALAEALPEHAARLDAIMLRQVDGAEDLARLLTDPRINAACLGPGLGLDDGQEDLVATALAWHLPDDPKLLLIDATDAQVRAWMRRHGHRPALVLDADALTLLARNADLVDALHDRCVLTPHAGEFARLFPDLAERLNKPATQGPAYSKVDATREAARRVGCTVLFKGPDTVIADPEGRCSISSAAYDRAAPWLATAGSGDVLAGMITGLLARGFPPMQAAETAAWLHVDAARSVGPGLIAEDLPEELPKVFRALGL